MDEEIKRAVKTVIDLRWNKEYASALDHFKQHLAPHGRETVASQPKLVSAVCDCLRETGKVGEAVRFVLNWLRLNPADVVESGQGKNISWLFFFYFQQIKGLPEQAELDFAGELLRQLWPDTAGRNVAERLLFAWAEKQKETGPAGWTAIMEMFEKIPVEDFSTDNRSISLKLKGKQKEVELASAFEQAIMLRIKAAFSLQQYERCIRWSTEALQTGIEFHYGNKLWVTRYIGLCYRQLGELDKAVQHLRLVLRSRKEWFIYKELADLHRLKQEYNEALQAASEGVLLGGYSPFKTGLFELMGDLYQQQGKSESVLWYRLAVQSRVESDWRVSMHLMQVAGVGEHEEMPKAAEQYNKILPLIQGLTKQTDQFVVGLGTLTRILHEGANGDGFITADDGRTVYFRTGQGKVPADKLVLGMRLSFRAVEEERKGKKTLRALKIYEAKE